MPKQICTNYKTITITKTKQNKKNISEFTADRQHSYYADLEDGKENYH